MYNLLIGLYFCGIWKETVDVELPKILNAQIKKTNIMLRKGRNVHKPLFFNLYYLDVYFHRCQYGIMIKIHYEMIHARGFSCELNHLTFCFFVDFFRTGGNTDASDTSISSCTFSPLSFRFTELNEGTLNPTIYKSKQCLL
jgi:hypothetical protein